MATPHTKRSTNTTRNFNERGNFNQNKNEIGKSRHESGSVSRWSYQGSKLCIRFESQKFPVLLAYLQATKVNDLKSLVWKVALFDKYKFDPCCLVEQKKKAAKEKAENEAHLKDEFYVNPEDEVEEWTPGK